MGIIDIQCDICEDDEAVHHVCVECLQARITQERKEAILEGDKDMLALIQELRAHLVPIAELTMRARKLLEGKGIGPSA